ncbi:RsiV family protein [Mycolicibacterium stellerae]|uniref:RsiV family protein n=1 Tax=Mycolicibacterium stellerae TaxID=2358193 RepID=UPI001F3917A5|nr:RsiV family protein [Mycolicibacterium stellerae]
MRRITAIAAVLAVLVASPAAPAAADTGVSSGKAYAVKMTSIDGTTTDRLGNWDAKFSELSGGDPAVLEAFNHASRVAVTEQIERAKSESNPGEQWNFDSNGQVTFRSIAVAQLILGTHYYGVHPTPYISTVVIDSRSADPVMLTDLFTDSQAGLHRLSELTGAEPRAENFVNWIPTAEGLEIHFAPYQFGIALPETKTVAWAALTDLLAPVMAGITSA